jgi:nucleotide-binding universal stress UspA family protein
MASASPPEHILVVVDGTDESFRAADHAIELGRSLGSKVTALGVVDTDTLRQLLSVKILVDAEMGELEDELGESARRQLEEVHERGMKRKVVIDVVQVAGNTEEVVPKEVQDRKVDLIALGGFDSSKARHDLVARQRQQIVDHASCPVLVVK